MKTKYIVIIVAALVAILVVALVVKAGKPKGTKVAVEKPVKRTIVEVIPANGKIQPVTEVKISPDVSGEIVELHVQEGDKVTRGQLLLKIKPDIYISLKDQATASLNSIKARLAQAEAQLVQAELNYTRNKDLHEQNVISNAEFENILSQYDVAKKEVEAARFNVSSAEASLKKADEDLYKTTVYAPMDGTVSMLSVEKGERVLGTVQMAGTEMLRIANLDAMEVLVDVNENDIVRVKLNDTAIVEVDAYTTRKFKGVVTQIANSAKNLSTTSSDQVTNFEVKVLLLPSSYDEKSIGGRATFLPGMSASVSIQTKVANNVLSIPIQAVTTREDLGESKADTTAKDTTAIAKDTTALKEKKGKPAERTKVFVVQSDNKVKVMPVETGIQDNTYIEVKGIGEEDEVVVAPYNAISRALKNGSLVQKTTPDQLFVDKPKR